MANDFLTMPPRYFTARVASIYFTLFLPVGLYLPFFPLWLDHLAYSDAQIGWIVGMPLILRIFTTPWISSMADRAPERVMMLVGISVVALCVAGLHFLPQNFWFTLLISLALTVAWAPQIPITDSIAVSGVRRYGANYPNMRVWGSISFLVMNLAAGVILDWWSASIFPWLLLGSYCVLLGWAIWGAPRIGQKRELGQVELSGAEKRRYLLSPFFVLTLLAAAFSQGSHGFMYTFGTIEWQRTGFSGGVIGQLWAFSVFVEVGMFFIFTRLAAKVPAMVLLALSASMGIVRWSGMAMGDVFDHALLFYFAMQALHAFSFALSYLVLQRVIASTIAEELTGAAQGLSYFAAGAMLGLSSIFAGPLYAAFGAHGFWFMAGLCGCSFIFATVNLRNEPRA